MHIEDAKSSQCIVSSEERCAGHARAEFGNESFFLSFVTHFFTLYFSLDIALLL